MPKKNFLKSEYDTLILKNNSNWMGIFVMQLGSFYGKPYYRKYDEDTQLYVPGIIHTKHHNSNTWIYDPYGTRHFNRSNSEIIAKLFDYEENGILKWHSPEQYSLHPPLNVETYNFYLEGISSNKAINIKPAKK